MLKICDGNKACSDIAYYFSEISSIYRSEERRVGKECM